MATPADRRRILIADDEPLVTEILSRVLLAAGFALEIARDGVAACAAADARCPDLVFLDLLLPRRDGYAVLFHLRSREPTRRVPVVFISGEPAATHAEIARTLGAQGFMSKPFDRAEVLATVEMLLGVEKPAVP